MSVHAVLRLSALALACALCSSTAIAQDRPWYLTLDAGVSRAADPSFAGGRLSTRPGASYGGAIGRQLGPDWRIEAAVMYRNHPVREVSSPGFDARPGDADWASLFLTVNLMHDFAAVKLGPASVRPYVGLGIGRAQEVDADLSTGGVAREFSGSGSARQLMAGLRWDYGGPWTADLGVSYADAGRIRLARTGGGAPVEARYRATTVTARVGYRF
jgi:opacity protein-like surface antigen